MAQAQQAGAVNASRDVDRAVEWVARCITGLALLPTRLDTESEYPIVAGGFIREFIVPGL
jgi:hypothetical protein